MCQKYRYSCWLEYIIPPDTWLSATYLATSWMRGAQCLHAHEDITKGKITLTVIYTQSHEKLHLLAHSLESAAAHPSLITDSDCEISMMMAIEVCTQHNS